MEIYVHLTVINIIILIKITLVPIVYQIAFNVQINLLAFTAIGIITCTEISAFLAKNTVCNMAILAA
jgi:hypothetical protein